MLRPIVAMAVAVLAWLPATAPRAEDSVVKNIYTVHINPENSFVHGTRQTYVVGSGPVQETWDLDISGFFDVAVTIYKYGCTATPFGEICQDQTSVIGFRNTDITVEATPEEPFTFPTFGAFFNNPPGFDGFNGPCSLTFPGQYCTGVSTGPLHSYEGTFDLSHLTLEGSAPTGISPSQIQYSYDISAQVVPLPASVWLFLSALSLGSAGLRTRPGRQISRDDRGGGDN